MAGVTHTFEIRHSDGSSSKTARVEANGDMEANVSVAVAHSTTNKEIDIPIDKDGLKGVFILAEGGALTVKTNSSSAPDDTITLTDGVPLMWTNEFATNIPVPFTADVTKIYVTNGSSTADAVLTIKTVLDVTP